MSAEEINMSKQQKKSTAKCRLENSRLVYYQDQADAEYWDNFWRQHDAGERYAKAEKGKVSFSLDEIFARHLPVKGRILEAGCGWGQVVLALRVRGYNIEGVEWASKTVSLAKGLRPDLPICTGDVLNLGVPDETYAGYISLGVVEHRLDGPEPFLLEAFRVLVPGGIAVISVPYINLLRQLKIKLGFYRTDVIDLPFYQYAFPQVEFCSLVEAAGFQIVRRVGYDGFKGIADEIPPLRLIANENIVGRLLTSALARLKFVENHFGHMLLLVCRKPIRKHGDAKSLYPSNSH